ncbi:MAG: DinB family protein [Actinomycetales bacterium]|nr:DinB family protein [Actinomycetales bacterium]
MTVPVESTYNADEATTLSGFLDYHRSVLRRKCEDLSAEQLSQTLPPSDMTLGGMLKHVAVVESSWFSEDLLGGPLIAPFDTVDWTADQDWEWHTAHLDTPAELLALYDASIEESRRITAEVLAATGLETPSVATTRTGEHYSLRWILVHMIEEYAQHNGHADLLRESIDGRTRF